MRFAIAGRGCACVCVCLCTCSCVCVWQSIIIIVLTKEHTQVSYEMQFHFCALYVNMLYVNLCVRLCQTLALGSLGSHLSRSPFLPLSLSVFLFSSPCLFLSPVDCRMRGHCPLAWYRLQPLSLAFSISFFLFLCVCFVLSRTFFCSAVKVSKVLEISAGFTRWTQNRTTDSETASPSPTPVRSETQMAVQVEKGQKSEEWRAQTGQFASALPTPNSPFPATFISCTA